MVTTIIAIIGLALAGGSFGWQCYTYLLSGSRIHVEVQFGIFGSTVELVSTEDGQATRLPPDSILGRYSTLPPGIYPELYKAIATIQNRGRLPVTIQRCIWQSTVAETLGSPHVEPGDFFPHRLLEHDHCTSVINLDLVFSLIEFPTLDHRKVEREVWPMVTLGNGKMVKGNSLYISAGAEMGRLHSDEKKTDTVLIAGRDASVNSKDWRLPRLLTSLRPRIGFRANSKADRN